MILCNNLNVNENFIPEIRGEKFHFRKIHGNVGVRQNLVTISRPTIQPINQFGHSGKI